MNTIASGNTQPPTSNAVAQALSNRLIATAVLFSSDTGLTFSPNTHQHILGTYNYDLIDSILPEPPQGYHKEFILNASITTEEGDILCRVYINNISTVWRNTWGGTTYRVIARSLPFKLSDIVLEPTYQFPNTLGINLGVETNDGTGTARVYNILCTCYYVKD